MAIREILHCDLDNFFASVEGLFNPSLAGIPFAVCGSVEERHGIVLAKNQLAKKYGVKTASAIWQAKQVCPQLVTVEPHYDRYMEFSRRASDIYYEYTDMVEPFGIDECWLDVSGCQLLFGGGENIAHDINTRIKKELGITVSIGVSYNKCFAKLGSDLNKPDGISVISPENFKDTVWPLPAEDLLWVGKSTSRALHNLGIFTIEDIAAIGPAVLKSNLGKNGEGLWNNAAGLECSPVLRECEHPPAKSIGRSVTGKADLTNSKEVWRVMLGLADKVSRNLRRCGFLAGMVQIHIRDSLLGVTEHQCRLIQPTRLGIVLADEGMKLFDENWKWQRPVRSIGIRASQLICDGESMQLHLDYDYARELRLERLEASRDQICARYGKNCVTRASQI